jgi:hypothetical protein
VQEQLQQKHQVHNLFSWISLLHMRVEAMLYSCLHIRTSQGIEWYVLFWFLRKKRCQFSIGPRTFCIKFCDLFRL